MKNYMAPEIDVVLVNVEDVITTSVEQEDNEVLSNLSFWGDGN